MSKGSETISSGENIIDSRSVIERIEYLRGELDALRDAVTEADNEEDRKKARDDLADWLGCDTDDLPDDLSELDDLKENGYHDGSDEARELWSLEDLASQCDGYGDWNHGETLIRDSYFTEYAQQLAEDIGAIGRDMEWPLSHIDWETAANELKQDYIEVSFDGTDYYMRS